MTWRCCGRPGTAPAWRTTPGTWLGVRKGSTPYTLLDYFPEDYLLFVDESHMTLPQVRAMYGGDRSRKEVLVDFGLQAAVGSRQSAL